MILNVGGRGTLDPQPVFSPISKPAQTSLLEGITEVTLSWGPSRKLNYVTLSEKTSFDNGDPKGREKLKYQGICVIVEKGGQLRGTDRNP